MRKSPTLLALALLFAIGPVGATPVTYGIVLTVERAFSTRPSGFTPGTSPVFAYEPVPGDVFHGSLTFDDAVLATDGQHTGVGLDAFHLEVAGLTWDPQDPSSVFRGFRGPGQGAPSPVLVSAGGALTGLFGGVYGEADYPFVDFFADGTWSSTDFRFNTIQGNLRVENAVAAVPEPATLWCLAAGAALLFAMGRRPRSAAWVRR